MAGESHRQRSMVGYSPWGHKESDMNGPNLAPTLGTDFSNLVPEFARRLEDHRDVWDASGFYPNFCG